MLQNNLLTFYFEFKLQVGRMVNFFETEICRLHASCYAVVISILWERIRASSHSCDRLREAHDLQTCACPFYDTLMDPFVERRDLGKYTRLWKGDNLRQFTSKTSGAETKMCA